MGKCEVHAAVCAVIVCCSAGSRAPNPDYWDVDDSKAQSALQLQTQTAECNAAAQQQLNDIKEVMTAVQEIVAECEGATENCIDGKKVEMLETIATTRLTEELEDVFVKCEQGMLDPAVTSEAKRISEGKMGIVPGTATSRLIETAPDMRGLKYSRQEAAAIEAAEPVEDTPADDTGIDGVTTDRVNEVLSMYENAPDHFSTLGESGDQMPMALKLYCNGGKATDKDGTEKFAFQTSEYVPGAPMQDNAFKSQVGWDDLDIYSLDSVRQIYQAAEFKVRGTKRGPGSCSSRDLKSFSFRIDKQTEAGGGFRYTTLFESVGGPGWEKFAEADGNLSNSGENDIFSIVRCGPEGMTGERPCFQPTDPALPYPADFPGFRQTPPGEFGVCLSRKDPETHLKKLTCAARALSVHMTTAESNSFTQTKASSAFIQARSDVAWAGPIMAVGSVLATALRGAALTLEISMTIVDNLVAASLGVVHFLAGLAVDIATTPLIPLLGKNQNRKREGIKKFVFGIYAIPLCVVSQVYSWVSFSMFALTYMTKHVAFFIPGGMTRSMQGSVQQSEAGQRIGKLSCFDSYRAKGYLG
jgi:hypothetical protein